MAKTNKLYMAQIGTSGDAEVILVDIFALPYDQFDVEKPLVILESVDMGKAKNRVFPDFTNVIIEGGSLNCNDFKINSETVLPYGFDVLVCDHAINDLGNLIGVLPSSVSTVVTRQAVLNAVKNKKSDALQKAQEFMVTYPDVNVTDGKQCLSDIMVQIYTESQATKTLPETPTVKPTPVSVALKTEEWLSVEELVTECRLLMPELSDVSDDVLARYVKMARSSKAGLRLNVRELVRPEDGAKINCVHRDCINVVAEFIVEKLAQQQERNANAAKKATPEKPVEKKTLVPVVDTPKPKQLNIDGKVVVETKIKKYIPNRLWNQIRGAAGNNKSVLLAILNDIECINIIPKQTKGKKVYYIKDGKLHSSSTVDFKNSRCLAQAFSGQNDKTRIIWGMSGDVFVCVNFYPEHDSNAAACAYRKFIREYRLDLSDVDWDKCLLVSDLIADMSEPHGKPSYDLPSMPNVSDTSEVPDTSEVSDTPEVPEAPRDETVVPSTVDVSVQKKQRGRPKKDVVVPTPVVSKESILVTQKTQEPKPVAESPKVVEPVQTVMEQIPEADQSPKHNWVDLYSMDTQFTVMIAQIDVQYHDLLARMSGERNTDARLTMTRDLHQLLLRKKSYEGALEKMRMFNDEMQIMCQNMEKQH